MDILSSNANKSNGNRNNIESQEQLMAALLPFDGNVSSSIDLLIWHQLWQQQQEQQRRGRPLNRHRDFSSAASILPAVSGAAGTTISSLDPAVRFGQPIHRSHHQSNIPSIAVNDRTGAGYCSCLDLQELPILLELERELTERALHHSALTLVRNDAVVCQSLAHLQQSRLTNTISQQQSSGSTLAPLASSSSYHSAPCSQAEVLCASADSVFPPHAQGLMDFVMASQLHRGDACEPPLVSTSVAAGAVAYPTFTESEEQTGPSKTSEMRRRKNYPLKATKEETKSRFGSKSFQNVHANRERRRYNAESFAQKLFRLITDQERAGNTQIVEFLDGGGGFWLRQPDAISKLMPKYNFRGNKFSGFRRQLYSYGFKVEKDGANKGAFKHPSFSRGNAALCKQIKRDNRYDFSPYDLDSCDESETSDGVEAVNDDIL